MLQAQILDADPLVVVFVALVATVAAKLHVLDHAFQLVLERVLEVAVEVAADRAPEVVIIHVQAVAQAVVVDATVVVADAPETVDPAVTVAVAAPVTGAKLLVQMLVEPVEADSVEIVVSSVEVNGGCICVMYM